MIEAGIDGVAERASAIDGEADGRAGVGRVLIKLRLYDDFQGAVRGNGVGREIVDEAGIVHAQRQRAGRGLHKGVTGAYATGVRHKKCRIPDNRSCGIGDRDQAGIVDDVARAIDVYVAVEGAASQIVDGIVVAAASAGFNAGAAAGGFDRAAVVERIVGAEELHAAAKLADGDASPCS